MNKQTSTALLVVIRHSPYGSSLARASLDTALAAAAFDVPVTLLFIGDGVLQLVPEQDSQAVGAKNIGRLLSSMPMYDIETVYADTRAAQRYGLDLSKSPIAAEPVNDEEIRALIANCTTLLGF